MYENILNAALFFKITAASHFFGGSIIWKPLDQSLTANIQIIFQSRFYWDFDTYPCNDDHILGQKIIGAREASIKIGNNLEIQSGVVCTDNGIHDGEYIWSGGQQSQIVTLNQSIGKIEANFVSCCWINLVYGGGSWHLKLKLDLNKRKDNNKTNSSPIALMSPLTILPLNYTSVIKIPTRDADFDVVKCRWSLSSLGECAGVCNSAPGVLLDQENCTITFTPEEEGFYVVALQIEDFYNATDDLPLSSIPLQFMLYAENKTIEEHEDQIQFYYVTPEDGSDFVVKHNETLFGQIVVNSSSRVVDLMTLSPLGLWKSPISLYNDTNDLWYVNFTWTHLETGQEGLNLFCFQAQNSQDALTELRCINLIGSITPRVSNRYSSTTSYFSSLSTMSSSVGEKPLEEDENNNWIIPLSISLAVLVLMAILGFVAFFLIKKCSRKNKIKNHFLQSDLDNILSREKSQITDNESNFDSSRPVSSTTNSSELDSNEQKSIIKKKKTPVKRFCIICGKTHVTGFHFSSNKSSNTSSHKLKAFKVDQKNEVYLKKKKNHAKNIKNNKIEPNESIKFK
ncbi:integrin beta A [Brachionus plicatilis]|uniref:Integrin beta A n=1 Tax=Brachionus plicatilis TaxID=10195 RepID=A0A3M7S9M7_BRAPC|nr:integrin beta A [Brachionus plicatilis]